MNREPIPKPKKRPKNQGRHRWQHIRREFLKDKQNHGGYYVCFDCKLHITNPEVDHIEKRSLRPDLVYELSNLRILCPKCHRKRHMML